MSVLKRIALAAAGAVVMLLSFLQMRSGHVVFLNASYHQQTYAVCAYGTGLLLIALALLPPSRWAYRKITTRRSVFKSR